MKYKIYISPEDRASNVYASSALWNGHTTNEKEQMGRCADYMERGLLRCGSFEVINAQYGNMYDRVKESNNWPADMHVAPHTNGFNGKAAGTRVHCYPSDRSRRIGKLIQDRIGSLSPGAPDFLVEDDRLYELRATHMAAVLPEFAFHDNPEDAQWLVDNGVQVVAEGANMPTTMDATAYLQEQGVLFAPGKASNAGGVATSALEMTQNSERLSWTFEEVDAKLKTIMVNIFHNLDAAAKEYGMEGNYVAGANIAGFLKVADAMTAQGIV